MKKPIKPLLTALAATILVSTIQSCKKGENDPFFSLRTRKARLEGEWKVERMTVNENFSQNGTGVSTYTYLPEPNTYSFSTTGHHSYELDGTTVTTNGSNTTGGDYPGSDSYVGTGTSEFTLVFKKDGTFSLKEQSATTTTYTENYMSSTEVYSVGIVQTVEGSGTWNFLGGVEKDYKNKERIVLNFLKQTVNATSTQDGEVETNNSTNTYDKNGQYSEIWQIVGLRNKEMEIVAEYKGSGTFHSSLVRQDGSYESSGNTTISGKRKANFVQD